MIVIPLTCISVLIRALFCESWFIQISWTLGWPWVLLEVLHWFYYIKKNMLSSVSCSTLSIWTYCRLLNVVFNSLCGFVLKSPYRIHCLMNESLYWLQRNSRRQFHWVQFIFNLFVLIVHPNWNSFWFKVDLHIHSDIYNIYFSLSPEYSKN